jgi:replicative DNA helicase
VADRDGEIEPQRTFADTVNDRLAKLRDVLDRKARGEKVELYIPTGLRDWDERGGLERGILTVIGAGTGDGKSMVKLHLAREAAKRGYRVLMLDFEDPGAKTADRSLSTVAGIDNRVIGSVCFDEFDYERLEMAATEIGEWAARIRHHTGLIDTKATLAIMASERWDLILIDYAQVFPEDADRNMERTIKDFSWAANQVAQQQDCAVVIFSQLKAEVEQRGYKIYEQWKVWGAKTNPNQPDISGFCPTGLSDVAWAKALADQSKCLLYLWRPGRRAQKLGYKKVKDDRLKVICGKVSFGSEDDLEFEFDGPTATLRDVEKKAA